MLSEEKKAEIRAQYEILQSIRKTAEKCKVGKSTVADLIAGRTRKLGKPMGRPKKLSKRDVRQIKRHVVAEVQSGHRVTSRSIKENLDLDKASRWTIQRELKRNKIFYKPILKKLPLTKKHKQERLNFAKRHLTAGTDFSRWIFSDEKRFNLDGPDNMSSYGTEYAQLNRIKRQMGGGSIMILGAISSKGNLLIKEATNHYKAADYILDLRTTFFPWARREMGKRAWTWQQDGSPVHRAHIVRDGFFEEEVATTEWPACSPDLNLIENVWSVLQAKVYEEGQFHNKKELLTEIKRQAKRIDPNMIKSLYASMNKRLVAVLEAKGGQID